MIVKKIFGYICNKIVTGAFYYKVQRVLTLFGERRYIDYPFLIQGEENMEIAENVHIGPGATIYTTNAKLKIKQHVITGPNLTIITGDHKYVLGRWIDSVSSAEKEKEYDKDVIIEEDVWIGCNVTILKGVTVGRSSIIAAGSLVVKDVPPYSVVGGVPAKVIKMKWSEEDIAVHESFIERNLS